MSNRTTDAASDQAGAIQPPAASDAPVEIDLIQHHGNALLALVTAEMTALTPSMVTSKEPIAVYAFSNRFAFADTLFKYLVQRARHGK